MFIRKSPEASGWRAIPSMAELPITDTDTGTQNCNTCTNSGAQLTNTYTCSCLQ